MLTTAIIEQVLTTIPSCTIGVLGDLFLDRYLDLDAALTEPSLETGLDAYQVTQVRAYPGAAGTVINNLAALGVGNIVPISMIGADGEGFELRQALAAMPNVTLSNLVTTDKRRTPTYTKPMLIRTRESPRELNRLDIKNRQPLPRDVENRILDSLQAMWSRFDVLLVLDQVSEPECGVVTSIVRDLLAESASKKVVIVDSRERIGLFRNVGLKPNERECLRAAGGDDISAAMRTLAKRAQRPVICTRGSAGMSILEDADKTIVDVPAFPVAGPIDVVGAGDSSNAALACALACGTNLIEAAAFGNFIASITIQQLGVTGRATPEQVRARWREVQAKS